VFQVAENLKLAVSGIFLNYHDDDGNVRFAMNTRVTAPGGYCTEELTTAELRMYPMPRNISSTESLF